MYFHKLKEIDKEWTLFLDRDGVINRKIENDYVRSLDMWDWLEGSKEAIVYFSGIFGKICILTNQRGIGRGWMTVDDLEKVHEYLRNEVEQAGGGIDRIYYCPHDKHDNCECRKPNTGMVKQALKDFPEIDPDKAIMVGDSISDMDMARDAGLFFIMIGENIPNPVRDWTDGDYHSLSDFAQSLKWERDEIE